MSNLPTIAGVEIPLDSEGRFNLNALHRAYEAERGEAQPQRLPSQWLRRDEAAAFVKAVSEQNAGLHSGPNSTTYEVVSVVNGGRSPGTFAHELIAVEYLKWLGGAATSVKLLKSLKDLDLVIKALLDFEVPEDLPDMYVYAIREKETGNIKLGISRDPEQRMRSMQTANSSSLELICYRKAANRFADERAIHADADAFRLRGEWFDSSALAVMQ